MFVYATMLWHAYVNIRYADLTIAMCHVKFLPVDLYNYDKISFSLDSGFDVFLLAFVTRIFKVFIAYDDYSRL